MTNEEAQNLNNSLEDVNRRLSELNVEGANAEGTFRNIAGSLQQAVVNSKDFKGEIRSAKQLSNNLAKSAKDLARFSSEDLADKKRSASFAKKAQDLASKRNELEAKIQNLVQLRENATEEEKANLDGVIQNLRDAREQSGYIADNFDEVVQANENLNQDTKFFDNLRGLAQEIPIIGKLFGAPFEKASKDMRQAKVEGANFFERFNIGAKAFDKILITGLLTSLFKADDSTTKLAKSLGVTKDAARELREEFNVVALDTDTSAVNSENMVQSMIELGTYSGAVAGFTNKQLVAQTKLTQLVGLQADEAANLVNFGVLNNETTDSITTGVLEQVAVLEKETGIRLNSKKILAEVANISGQLGAQYGYNTQQLAKAVVQSQRLGLSLEDSKNIAGNLLDFESSITNELEAELLLGRNLNLEQARLLALQGDSAGAAAELAKQFGSAEEFSSLNVIQQESLAKAMGMSVDQLADSIKKQQVLNTLGEKNFDQLMKTEAGRERIKNIGGEELLASLEQQSATEKFQQAIIKLQTTLGTLMEGEFGKFIDGLTTALSSSTGLYTMLGLIGALNLMRVISQIAAFVKILRTASVAAAITKAFSNPVAFAASSVLALGAAGLIARSMRTEDDMIMPSGYGDRILSSPKGSIALNNQDTIVAGTNLGQGSSNQETQRTNMLLEKLITQNDKKPQLSPVGLYEVQ